jgi:hypothetical protein
VLGKQVIPVFRDGASDAPTFAAQASALLANPNITSVFGSASHCSSVYRAASHPLGDCFVHDVKVLDVGVARGRAPAVRGRQQAALVRRLTLPYRTS